MIPSHSTVRAEADADSINQARLDSMLMAGIAATRNLEFEKSQGLLSQLIAEAEINENNKYVILGYINLGNLYNYYSLYDQALENLFIALEMSDSRDLEIHKNAILNNIGIVYSKNGSSEKAGEYFLRALKISQNTADTNRIAMNLINLAYSLSDREMNDSALSCVEDALNLYGQSKQETNYWATLNNIGNIYHAKNNLDSALYFYTKAYHSSSEKVDPWLQWEFALNLARSHFELGRLDSAEIYLAESIQGFKQGNDQENLIEALKLQSEVLLQKGDAEGALSAALEAMNVQDSLVNVQAKDWISKHQLNYEFGKKQKELELVEAEAHRKLLIWIFGSIGLAIILILVWMLMRSRLTRLNQRNLLLEKEQSVTQLTLEKNIADQKRMEEEHLAEQRINQVEREKLQQELDFKNRMLMSKVMSFSNQNEQMNEVVDLLNRVDDLSEEEMKSSVLNAKKMIQNQINLENDWESVKVHFEEVHPDFFTKLSTLHKNLNSSDLRMCAYLVLDLSPKEISNILNIAPASIRKRKQRLKEKMDLNKDVELSEWLRINILNTSEQVFQG